VERAAPNTGLFYICNPHSSTGAITPRAALRTLLEKRPPGSVVVIDEAYYEYAQSNPAYASWIDMASTGDRVIVTRTFSKIYGLEELRIGYAVTSPELAATLARHALPGAVTSFAMLAAVAALEDQEYVRRSVERTRHDYQDFINMSHARLLHSIDSQTSFILVHAERPAAEVIEHFRRYHIALTPPMPYFAKHVRVAIGTPTEMLEFWRVWDLMPPRPMSM